MVSVKQQIDAATRERERIEAKVGERNPIANACFIHDAMTPVERNKWNALTTVIEEMTKYL